MAITIYKYAYHISNNIKGVGITVSGSSGGFALADFNSLLTNYYTIYQLQTAGSSAIHFDNLTDAYHNNLLNLQGGISTSGEDSSGLDAEYYHLSEDDYTIISDTPGVNKYLGTNGLGVKGWYDYEISSGSALYTFGYSLEEDSAGTVTLVNDLASPGNSKYYGTNGAGVRGFYDIGSAVMVYPGAGVAVSTGSAWGTSLASANLSSVSTLTYASASFVKMTGTNTFTLDTTTYSASSHNHSGVYIPIISDPVAGYFPIAQSNGTLAMSILNGASFATADHTHGLITNAGYLGTSANYPLITTTGGQITTGGFGTTQYSFCEGNDSRLSNSRTPTAHQLDSATYHTVSGLTTGHFLKALSATTFGFVVHGLTYLDVGAAAVAHTHTGYVDVSGAPENNQIAIYLDSNTIEGTANLTYDGTTLTVLSGVTTTTLTTSYIVSAGDLWLIPNEGNAVYIGGINYTSTQAFLYTAGTQTNIALKISSKGNGALYLGNQVVSGGGLIYFGDGVGGLNAKTTETDVVYYNSSTGLLTYGAASTGNVTLSGSTNNTVCTVTGANAIIGEANLTFNGSALVLTGTQTVSSTITAANFILSSDERLKRYIQPLNPLYLDIPYKQFELINEEGQLRYGVVAQDIKGKYPELVREGDGMLSVAYIDLLIREIVYLKDKVKKLERAIEYE